MVSIGLRGAIDRSAARTGLRSTHGVIPRSARSGVDVACKRVARPIKPRELIGEPVLVCGCVNGLRFNLIDKIEALTDERIVAIKQVSLAEEYLADHFPTFPVLPGVMMLEAMTQAAGWVLHRRAKFGKSMAVLKEARNVKYGQFVAPGELLRVEVEYMKPTDAGASFKATGFVGGQQSLTARLEIAYFNLADKQPELAGIDAKLIEHNKTRWSVLTAQGEPAEVAQPALSI
jgi:3-hydroxyacyl-[acyl-carrier-protein] dehydratase